MTPILAVGDIVWQSAIGAIVSIVLAWFAYKLKAIGAVAEKTHTLVNSAMRAQLKMHAIVTRRLAAITKEPADADAATQAEQLLKEHDDKQAVADSNKSEMA